MLFPFIDACSGVICPNYGICKVTRTGYQCLCASSCSAEYNPVCGSDGKTYTNLCNMKAKSCTSKTIITVALNGECGKGYINDGYTVDSL